jgi:hypothetical protein
MHAVIHVLVDKFVRSNMPNNICASVDGDLVRRIVPSMAHGIHAVLVCHGNEHFAVL